MERISFLSALLKTAPKDVILRGKDNVAAIRFSYNKIASPSLIPLSEEEVEYVEEEYLQTITFKRLTAKEIVSRILSYR